MESPTIVAFQWLSFWDSFNVAVNSKPGLSDIEKFNYLRTQLFGEAQRAISGYPLTSENYARALETLKERFGQPHKVVNAHMSALLELDPPSNNLYSLKSFCDAMETNIRTLEALGKSQDTFGELLIPIILGKLPDETKRNLARSQRGKEWSIQDLRQTLKNELRVLEAGGEQISDPSPTASFYAGVQNSTNQGRNIQNRPCIYCKGPHSPIKCMAVTDLARRKSIISKGGLCYNCLSSTHRCAKCPSRYRCRNCGAQHHTTICDHNQHAHPPLTLPSSPPPPPTRSNNQAALDSGSSTSTQPAQGPGNSNQTFQAEDPVNHQSVLATLAPTQQAVYEYPILLKSQVKVGSTS